MNRLVRAGEIPTLTGVRGIAAVWVVIFHLYPSFAEVFGLSERASVPLVASGFMGVDLFFILSGFIMSYVHGRDFVSYTWREHKRFLLLRACRIYPLHLVCLGGFCALILLLPDIRDLYGVHDLSLPTLIATTVLVQNWGVGPFSLWNSPTWSLSAELLGYAIFPFITLGIRRYVRPHWDTYAITGILLFFLATLYIGNYATLDSIGKTGVVRMLTEFTAGCLVYRMLSGTGMRANPEIILWVAMAVLAISISSTTLSLLAPFGLALLIAALALPTRSGTLIFANRVTLWLGQISFSLYLSHMLVLTAFDWHRRHIESTWSLLAERSLAVACVPLTLLLSFLLWKFIEMPSRTYFRRYISSRVVAPENLQKV